ncbi:MAG: aldo/keto reductase [Chloroflexota bacterium]
MEYRRLGRTGLKVSAYCVGGDNFGLQTEETEALRIMGRAFDAGVNFIDTANSYADQRSEEIVGRFLKGRREETVLATKCSSRAGDGMYDRGLSRKAVMKAIDDSLHRLQTDYVDLYQIHWPDPETPLDETLRAFDDILRAGKARYIGCSNFPAYLLAKGHWISAKHNLARFDSVQPKYNLIHRDAERELLPYCREAGVGVIAYSPMAGGFLTGKHSREAAVEGSRFSDEFRAAGFYRRTYWTDAHFNAVERYLGVCNKYDLTPHQLGLAWVRSQPGISACIAGARSEWQLQQNLDAWGTEPPREALDEAQEVADWLRDNAPYTV